MKNYHRYIRALLFAATDYFSVLLAEFIAMQITYTLGNPIREYYLANSYIYMWIPAIFLMFNMMARVYTMRPIIENIKRSFYATVYGLATSMLLLYFVHSTMMGSRWFPFSFVILTFSIICITRFSVWKVLKINNWLNEPVIVIGAGLTAEKALRYYEYDLGYRYEVLGIIDDNPISESLAHRYKNLGGLKDAGSIVKKSGVKTVIITVPGLHKDKLSKLIGEVSLYARNISFVPDLIGAPVANLEAMMMLNEKIVVLKVNNNLSRLRNRLIKRCFDIVGGLAGVILFAIPMLIISILIRIDSDGAAFFNAKRIGKNGKEFKCYKFRSMYKNSDEILEKYLTENPEAKKEWQEFQKLKNYDPRVTKIGRFIRKYSLDELPQIFNVVLGNMSLVGPRPYLPREQEMMGQHYHIIKMTVPGITGLWQVSGRNDVSFEGRLDMDVWYVQNWSVWWDIVLLFKTVRTVLGRHGAY